MELFRFRFAAAVLAPAMIFLSAGATFALKTSSANVTCSTTTKLQSRIDAVVSGTIATFRVSGICNENLTIPTGKTIVIVGATATAKITPFNTSLPAVTSFGNATVQTILVENGSGTAETLMLADKSGYLYLNGATATAPNVDVVVAIYGQSGGRIANSRITGGKISAVESWDGSGVIIAGNPTEVQGPDGLKSVISSPAGLAAVNCGVGGTVAIRANSSGTTGGAVLINNSKSGIGGHECTLQLNNATSSPSNMVITGISAGGSAIALSNGSVTLQNVQILQNAGSGINVAMTTMRIGGSLFSGNQQGDINANLNSTISLGNQETSFVDIGTGQTFSCSSGGKIYWSQSAVVQSISNLPDLPTCVQLE